MIKLFKFRSAQRGFSLTEIAVVLGVIGAVLAGVMTAASAVRAKSNISNAAQELQIILKNMNDFMGSGYSVAGVNDITKDMTCAGIIPASYATTNTCGGATPTVVLGNPWGGTVKLWWDGTNRLARISFFGLSGPNDCIGLVNSALTCQGGRGCVKTLYSGGSKTATSQTTGGIPNDNANSQNIYNFCRKKADGGKNDYTTSTENSVEFEYPF